MSKTIAEIGLTHHANAEDLYTLLDKFEHMLGYDVERIPNPRGEEPHFLIKRTGDEE